MMVDWKMWRFILFTAVPEIIIAVVVAIILIAIYPAFTIYIVLGATAFLVIYIWISYYIYRPVVKHQQINPQDELIGQQGVTITDLSPRGQVKIRREPWSARIKSGFLPSGTKIKVIEMDGIQLIVEKIQD